MAKIKAKTIKYPAPITSAIQVWVFGGEEYHKQLKIAAINAGVPLVRYIRSGLDRAFPELAGIDPLPEEKQ